MNKRIMILLWVVMMAFNAHAQQKVPIKDLTGTWKVFSMNIPGEMYFNFLTDSISVKAEEGDDSTMIAFKNNMVKESLKAQTDKMYFIMDSYGNMYEGKVTGDDKNKMGKYDEAKGTILMKDKDSDETKEIQLVLKDDILSLITVDKGKTVTIFCKKHS